MTEREELEEAIAALERQRAVIGDAVVDTALATLRAKLARLDIPEQQLKPVTILFTDVVGSMALSQPLDPEDIHAIIDGALQRFTSIVESQRGRVLQYAGDSLLAVFGAIESHEDDPERAVRAGLGILDEAKRLAVQIEARHRRDDFHVRVGIHTGPVLLGGGVDAEGTIRGSAVNIAARMEQTAPVDCLRISRTTYRHVRGMFDVLDEPPIAVKGMADPIRSYVVVRARPRAFRATNRGVDGAEMPMIGRDAEFGRLVDMFEAVRTQRTLSLVTVVGDAGLGKTRFESVQLVNLGEVERSVGNYLVAADRLETGLQLCREVGAAKFRVHFLLELAELANVRGDSVAALGFVTEGLAVARAISNRDLEAALIVVQGDARLSLGQPIEARDSYRLALGIGRELGPARVPVEPVAGLARVAAALGDIDEGLAHVAHVEARIDAGECMNEAAALLWTCHTVLLAAGAPRANTVLIRAHSLLTEQAKLLDEADRTTFLGNVPSHRAIMTACAAATSR